MKIKQQSKKYVPHAVAAFLAAAMVLVVYNSDIDPETPLPKARFLDFE